MFLLQRCFARVCLCRSLNIKHSSSNSIGLSTGSRMLFSVCCSSLVSNRTVTDCDKYTIWVRVNGPEIFAGEAQAFRSSEDGESCFWEFAFELQQPGPYEVDVKLLLWNGDAPILENQCESTEGLPSNETMEELKHEGFQGFKMYEARSHTPHFISWSSPFLRMENPTPFRNGCELYFDPNNAAPDEYVPVLHLWPRQRRRRQRRLKTAPQVHGNPHSNPSAYFMGCGWSFWFTLDFPCLLGDLDDRVFSVDSTFEAIITEEEPTKELQVSNASLPLCTLANEQLETIPQGRWVREPPSSNVHTCPLLNTVNDSVKTFEITEFTDERPECWRRESLSIIGDQCMEMNCRFIQKKLLWKSSLHKETDFAGSWQPYSCRYQEFSTKQLQECVTRRKIVSTMDRFVQYRLLNVTLYPNKKKATAVVFDTLALLHKAKENDGSFEQESPRLYPTRKSTTGSRGFSCPAKETCTATSSAWSITNRILPASTILAPNNYLPDHQCV